MKTITPYLLRFALAAACLAIIFRYFLSYGIDHQSTMTIILSAILYGVSMFISGWYFGKRDGNYLPIYDVGFRFHLTTYLVHNSISELWFILGFNSEYESIDMVHSTAWIWAIFVTLHIFIFLLMRKHSINSLNKDDLFD